MPQSDAIKKQENSAGSEWENGSGRYQLSVRGLVLYLSLWGLIFGGFRFLQEHSSLGAEGSYTIQEGRILDFGLPILIGLTLVALGITIAYLAGSIRHVWRITCICFLVGWLFIPVLWITLLILGGIGWIDLD